MGKHGDPRKSRSKIPAFSKGASSANPDRKAGKKANGSGGSLRDKATINRINMYKGGRVKRDKKGVLAATRARTDVYEEKYADGRGDARARERAGPVRGLLRATPLRRLFAKGQSRRIWAELYKVLDCSDVVVHVVDARDVPGTTCDRVVTHLKKTATHKHLLFVVNKCDLVPNCTRSSTAAKQISVGIVGYPSVGKSAVINSLRAKQVCKVAPIPGETKVWQYVTLTKRVNLIDCPGVVYDDPISRVAADEADDANAVLKGVVRAERLPDPTLFLVPLLRRCDPKHALARKMGRLLRGGEPDVRTVAVQMINDWQRGKLPHFVPPPAAAGDGNASGEPEAAADDLAALEDANEAAAQTALDGEAANPLRSRAA
ncbi:GTP binding protein [Aureococcus anophagefferens]|nr:GTP binding protein [Aureococcus anophagefferens]